MEREPGQTVSQAQAKTRASGAVRWQYYPLSHHTAHSSNRNDTTVWAQMFVYNCASNPTVKRE